MLYQRTNWRGRGLFLSLNGRLVGQVRSGGSVAFGTELPDVLAGCRRTSAEGPRPRSFGEEVWALDRRALLGRDTGGPYSSEEAAI